MGIQWCQEAVLNAKEQRINHNSPPREEHAADEDPFPMSNIFREKEQKYKFIGILTFSEYQRKLDTLREKVWGKKDKVFKYRQKLDGQELDSYTGKSKNYLEKNHQLEVDHIWEIQQLATAITWTDAKSGGTRLTFAQLLYIKDVANDLGNLNVTCKHINQAKGATGGLIPVFLERLRPNIENPKTKASSINERLRSDKSKMQPIKSDILQNIGQCSIKTLENYWKNALVVKPKSDNENNCASWTTQELQYFSDLFKVLEYMARRLWSY
jgi:hypothetical protein